MKMLDTSLFKNTDFVKKYSLSTSGVFLEKDFKSVEGLSSPEILRIQITYTEVQNLFIKNLNTQAPNLTVFEGPGELDGHSFVVNNSILTFLDLTLIRNHQAEAGFQDSAHLVHEMSHGIHYQKSPEFAIYEKNADLYTFRRVIAEGVATYITELISKDFEIFWYGMLSAENLPLWKKNCELSFVQDVRSMLKGESEVDLLSISDFSVEGLNRSRRAYHHGYRVVQHAADKHSLNEILELQSCDWQVLAEALS